MANFQTLSKRALDMLMITFRAQDDDLDVPGVLRDWWTSVPPATVVDALSNLIDFPLMDDQLYAFGRAHPGLKKPGASMILAFEPFLAAVKKRYPDLAPVEAGEKGHAEQNIVTFGSPISNNLAQASMGYAPLSLTKADANEWDVVRDDNFIVKTPVKYEFSAVKLDVNRGRYHEPRWSILAEDQVFLPAIAEGTNFLLEDYLILSCVPNMSSDNTERTMQSRVEIEQIRRRIRGTTGDERYKLMKMEEDYFRSATQPIFRTLVVGGLHGPGTAAANLALSDRMFLKALSDRVTLAGLAGKFWQALIHVPSVTMTMDDKRDRPDRVGDIIGIFEVEVPQSPR